MADPWFTDADIETVWQVIYEDEDTKWALARAVLASLAPRIAQERADALREFAAQVEATYPEDVFPPDSITVDARSAAMARVVAKQARARADDLEREAKK